MKENENSAGYTYLAVSRPPATVELLRRSGKDRGEEGTQGKENQISFDQELKEEGGAWKTALAYASNPIALSCRNAGQSRSRAVGSELVDVSAQIDLYITAFGRRIDTVSS